MKSFIAISLTTLVLAGSLAAQQPQGAPSPAELQRLAQQPGAAEQIRRRLEASGLTPAQVRSRLQAAGYSSSLLDAYLSERGPSQGAAPTAQELNALQALGLPAFVPDTLLPVDTGLIVRRETLTRSSVFGVNVFRRTTTQFLPALAGPVPPDYRVGPGDQLVLILTGDVENAYSLQVTREGFILIPQVGQIHVANLTIEQLRNVLYTRLGRVYSGVRRGTGATTQFDVTVASVRAVQTYVVGEVIQPGAYQLSALGTVLAALYAAGGVTEQGNTRSIEVRRAGRTVATFDLYDYLLRGDTRNDIRIETGDVIHVPVHGTRAEVRGAVMRPAIYELKATETLADLLASTGGFRADAARARLSVERVVPVASRRSDTPPRMVLEVPLGPGGTLPPLPMEDGDLVLVDSLGSGRGNFVQIRGSVYQPGRYGLESRMTVSRLVQLAGGFRPATYSGRAHIERLNAADSTRSLISVELPDDSAAAWPNDLPLHDLDIVTIYSRPSMRDSITVAIAGMVNEPGRLPWRQGMTLRDLVLMARGTRFGAWLQEAEIARLPADRSQGQMATTIRVPLDSTYLFDRDSLGRYIGPPGLAFRASGAPEVVLEPYDNVLILRQPDFELQRAVRIMGEVQFPGTYALREKDERLADLLLRVGGLTPRAYPEGIRFYRSENNAGRINIDLPRALREADARDNVILQPGDSIFIPEYQASVRVSGAVNAPGSVLWRRGAGMGYYIAAAGGFARLADKRGASVRQANGTVETGGRFLIFRSEPEPSPGADVSVPQRDASDRTDYVALFGGVAQILASLVAVIVVVTR